ncbi:hypothetical protein EJB05_11171 [Eragrostis curvula]|uniref:Uncharacterized protein n=1 Tax=Eragrostis curvula TaxID=38414 RepID=A0A5J9VQF2_9POAL|nr:hypothetical protein EJB05_11171 [Eragrostis curvula]
MFERSVMVCGVSDRPVYIKAYYGCYDPLAYPLFYPGGEAGWNEGILYQETKKKNKTGKKKKKTEDPDEDFPSAMDIDDEAEADRTGGQDNFKRFPTSTHSPQPEQYRGSYAISKFDHWSAEILFWTD